MGHNRTFISFAPPLDIREEMTTLQDHLKESHAEVKWEHPDQFHATIKFLGDMDERALPDVLATVRGAVANFSPLTISFQTLGAFPTIYQPRIVWVSCNDSDGSLLDMKELLDSMLLRLGFPKDEQIFHPHVTLGRVKSNRNVQYLTPMLEKCTFEPRITVVDGISVMKSLLTPQGAKYSTIQSIHLRLS